MNTEVFAEWMRRQGRRVIRTPSSYWYNAAPGVFQAFPYHWLITPTRAEIRHLMLWHGALAVRYSTPFDTPHGLVSYHVVLQEPYSLDLLKAQARNGVKSGMKHFRIQQIPFERLATDGWDLQEDTLDRQGRQRGMTRREWEAICIAACNLPGFEAWAAMSGSELAAAVITARVEDIVSVPYALSHRRFLGEHVNNALFYCVAKEMLQREGVENLFFTVQSLDAPANVDEFKFRMGLQKRLVRQCVEFNPLLRPFARPMVHDWARNLLQRDPSGRILAKAEGMLRFHLEGRKPIAEQAWPDRLQPERSQLAPRRVILKTDTGIKVALATPFDINALVDLHCSCFTRQEHIPVQLGKGVVQAIYRWFVTSPETYVLAAWQGDRIVGFTALSDRPYNLPMFQACRREMLWGWLRHPQAIFSGDVLWRLVGILRARQESHPGEHLAQIAFTGVDPSCQGQGIGKALKDASIQICRERGMVAVSTGVRRHNRRARLLNEQAGFVVVPSRSTRWLLYLRLELGDAKDSKAPGTHPEAAHERAGTQGKASHILLVVPYYWPVLSAATHLMKDLAEDLAESGRIVTVLTNGPASGRLSIQDPPLLRGRIHRAWNPFLRRMGVVSKFCEYLWYMAFFVLRGLAVRKVDLIFVASTPPLAGLPAVVLARLKGAKLVYNLQDIFPDSAVVAGILPGEGWLYRWLHKAEVTTYRVSDLVASISTSFSGYVQRLVPGTRVATIPNWVDTDFIRPQNASQNPDIAVFRQGGSFVVQYAGNLGFMQNLEVVLGAAERLKDVRDIRFVFIGDGNAKSTVVELAMQRRLDNCTFLPLQPLDKVPAVYNACDLGVIPLKPGAAQIAVPSKTWNYLAAGRPVIGCVEGGSPLAQVIRESRSGSVVSPSDSETLASMILEYRNAPDRVRMEGQAGRTYVDTFLSRSVAIRKYIQMFDNLLDQSGGEAPAPERM